MPHKLRRSNKRPGIFFGVEAEVWLFGSRVDDTAKGGDVDLYVRSMSSDAYQLAAARFAFLARLKRRMGDRILDLVLQREGARCYPSIHSVDRAA